MIKIKKRKILLLPGDGIGQEVIAEVKKIIQRFNKNKSLSQVGYFTNYMLKKKSSKRTNDPIFSHLIFGKNVKNFESFR